MCGFKLAPTGSRGVDRQLRGAGESAECPVGDEPAVGVVDPLAPAEADERTDVGQRLVDERVDEHGRLGARLTDHDLVAVTGSLDR